MIGILILLLLLLILAGLPVILAVAAAGFMGVIGTDGLVLALFPQKMFAQLNSFTLLALPYFILAGSIMARGGISARLVQFAQALVGHFKAGLAHVAVVSSMVFAGISGSSVADASAISSILIPTMKKVGYKPGYCAALIATSGTIGAIIPPSMIMVIYGAMAQVSIGGLFLAGIIPGVLVGLSLMLTIKGQTYLPKYPELREKHGKFSIRAVFTSATRVWSALIAPVIIVGGILGGIFTATEAGVACCIYAFVISFFVYRTISIKDMVKILVDAAVTTAMVSGIIAVAGTLGWLLTYLEFNDVVLGYVTGAASSPIGVMLILAAVMLVLTMFVEPTSVLIVFVPVAVYIGQVYQIDPFQLGLVMVMANQIGSTTPPMAALLFVTTSIAKTHFMDTVRYVWPFILTEVAVLLLVIFFEPVAAFIPNWALG
ncbi:TRAP transporter large permease [Cohaesibacter haloalkalitolerans]|uniref:TRAP transporter large permease n=1 Tax=Cohaesibacter haloalkalitolerans TaxID=1162980 RepID=UPI000E64EB22|nr:TRAP transporter large permease [Cohaesibacter haloalkalitolerans]